MSQEIRIVAISDTHGLHRRMPRIPDGDILVHAGDLTGRGTLDNLVETAHFLREQPHQHKIVIAGNHDFCLQLTPQKAREILHGLTYLEDESATIYGLRFYGSPWQPRFYDWAFNASRGRVISKIWERIPEDTDVLVTHGPPLGILDRTDRGKEVGCADLTARLEQLQVKLHIFGHIHEGYGRKTKGGTRYLNASICTADYSPQNKPLVVRMKTTSSVSTTP